VQGTGLGLALSKHLSDLLGGKLTLASELDKGTTVTLMLPRNYGAPLV
jgi:signal transduction histidine kinase